MDVEATTVRIQAAEGNNNEDFAPFDCIISAVGEVLSSSSVNRSEVLKNMVTDSNGEETETTLPIAPDSFRRWLLFDCKNQMAPEALCNVVQVRSASRPFLNTSDSMHCPLPLCKQGQTYIIKLTMN